MATIIKCSVNSISKPMELQGGISIGYSCSANVSNPANNKKITFGPVNVSPFSFSVQEPDNDTKTALIKWLVDHEIKSTVTFEISDQEKSASSRKLELEQVCLESYNESISEYGSQISLSMSGQKVKVNEIPVDMTVNR
jgi:hypothetical protein